MIGTLRGVDKKDLYIYIYNNNNNNNNNNSNAHLRKYSPPTPPPLTRLRVLTASCAAERLWPSLDPEFLVPAACYPKPRSPKTFKPQVAGTSEVPRGSKILELRNIP